MEITETAEIILTTTAAQLQTRVQRNWRMNRLVADADEIERVVAREKTLVRLVAAVAEVTIRRF